VNALTLMFVIPEIFPLHFLLISALSLAVLGWVICRPDRPAPLGLLLAFLGGFAVLGVVASGVFPEPGPVSASSFSLLLLFLAVFMGVLGFVFLRGDHPEEISVFFLAAPALAVGGLLLIVVGSIASPEVGVGLLSVGLALGLIGSWMAADSGIRGFRFFFSGIFAAMAAPAVILQQWNTAGFVLALAYGFVPLFFLMPPARRKLRPMEEIREFERRGKIDHPVLAGDTQNQDAEVVVVTRKAKKKKKSRRARARLSSAQRPIVIQKQEEPEGEEVPFFGEGVLATEPGRQGQVQIDPWTGAAVQPGGVEEGDEASLTAEEDPENRRGAGHG